MKPTKKAAAVPPVETKPTPTSPHAHPEELALSRLRVWPGNPRKTVGDVSELAASIAKVGVIEPLLVRELLEVDGEVTHEVIAGQRRFMAAIVAGLATVPTMVRELADDDALELALAENAARTDVHPLEECEALAQLIETHKRRPEQVADRLGRPVRWVERRLSLRLLAPLWREDLITGRLPLAHAEMLARLDLDTQRDLHGKCERFTELPSARAFARELRYHLRNLATPPFDVTDASLPGGACKACPKRSDAQPDLFDAGDATTPAHCLDTGCWSKKCDVTWERAKKAAARAKLTVIEDPAEVFTWGASLKWDSPYVAAASLGERASEMKPVAVARDDRGGVHQLYDRAAVEALKKATVTPPTSGDAGVDEDEDEEDDEAWEARREAETQARQEAQAAATKSDLAKLRALPLPRLARASLLASDPWDFVEAVRVLGRPDYKGEDSEFDAWVMELADGEVVEIALATHALSRFQAAVEQVASEDGEVTDADREVYGDLLSGEAVTDEVEGDDEGPAEEPAAAAPPATTPAAAPAPVDDPLDVFYLTRDAWDHLSESGRDQLRRPTGSTDPAQHVAWEERSRFVRSAPLSCHDDRWVALTRVQERLGLMLVGAELPSCRSCGVSGRIEQRGAAWADETKTVCAECAKPATSALVEIELDDWPSDCAALDVFDATRVVLWTSDPKSDRMRTIVPADMAAEVRTRAVRAGAKVTTERASTGPSHVVEIGGVVATPDGDRRILGFASSGGRPVDALALDTPDGPRVAMLDAAAERGGRVDVVPDRHYAVTQVDGAWCYSEQAEAPPPKKGKSSKKAKAEPAAKLHREQPHPFDTRAKVESPNVPCLIIDGNKVGIIQRPKGSTDESWRKAAAIDVENEPAVKLARLYSKGGVCLWDSRDGGKP